MTELAESARGLPDARIRKLVEWIRTNMCFQLGKPGAKWNETRCIIFTEYDDTKRYLQQQVEAAISSSDLAADRVLIEPEVRSLRQATGVGFKLAF